MWIVSFTLAANLQYKQDELLIPSGIVIRKWFYDLLDDQTPVWVLLQTCSLLIVLLHEPFYGFASSMCILYGTHSESIIWDIMHIDIYHGFKRGFTTFNAFQLFSRSLIHWKCCFFQLYFIQVSLAEHFVCTCVSFLLSSLFFVYFVSCSFLQNDPFSVLLFFLMFLCFFFNTGQSLSLNNENMWMSEK